MKRLEKALVLVTGVAVLGTAGTVLAYADGWTIQGGEGSYTARVAEMPSGETPIAKKTDSHAVISWSRQEIAPGAKMQRYVVTAYSIGKKPTMTIVREIPASGASIESAIFSESELTGRKWQWAIQPKLGVWVGSEGTLSNTLDFPGPTTSTADAPVAVAADRKPAPADAAKTAPTATPTAVTSPQEQEAAPAPAESGTAAPAPEVTADSPGTTQTITTPQQSASDESTAPPAT